MNLCLTPVQILLKQLIIVHRKLLQTTDFSKCWTTTPEHPEGHIGKAWSVQIGTGSPESYPFALKLQMPKIESETPSLWKMIFITEKWFLLQKCPSLHDC